ncbi:MAG: phycobilisome rod-core linker polypeptide [Cyanobacteria bacterium J06621_11]
MVSTFINPVVNPDRALGVSAFTDNAPIDRWSAESPDDLETVINAIYRQILSNAYVMESERQQVAESQFKRGELSVADFIRQIAKSDLYRVRFFENGPRNRFIELNFKHFLGRAPENRAEVAKHSAILDSEGYEAEIDSYLDSDEYNQAFGPDTVPFYRGYKTEASTPTGFTHMFSLLRGASSSDKQVMHNNPARLSSALLADQSSAISSPSGATNRQGFGKTLDINSIIQSVLNRPTVAPPAPKARPVAESAPIVWADLTDQSKSQAEQIEQLEKQLAELRSLSTLGEAILRKGQRPAVANSASSFGNDMLLVQQVSDQAKQIEKLQAELMSARSLATIAEFKLNKWRQRSY